jgi:hypothetical protein
VRNYGAEFRRCLDECDVVAARRLWAYVSPHLPQPKNDHETLMIIHRARTEAKSIGLRKRAYSHRWLLDNNYPSGLPDYLRSKAERMYPRIVEGVGISLATTSSIVKSALPIIRKNMSDAVMECYASREIEPSFVKRRIMEAKKRITRELFGHIPGIE